MKYFLYKESFGDDGRKRRGPFKTKEQAINNALLLVTKDFRDVVKKDLEKKNRYNDSDYSIWDDMSIWLEER